MMSLTLFLLVMFMARVRMQDYEALSCLKSFYPFGPQARVMEPGAMTDNCCVNVSLIENVQQHLKNLTASLESFNNTLERECCTFNQTLAATEEKLNSAFLQLSDKTTKFQEEILSAEKQSINKIYQYFEKVEMDTTNIKKDLSNVENKVDPLQEQIEGSLSKLDHIVQELDTFKSDGISKIEKLQHQVEINNSEMKTNLKDIDTKLKNLKRNIALNFTSLSKSLNDEMNVHVSTISKMTESMDKKCQNLHTSLDEQSNFLRESIEKCSQLATQFQEHTANNFMELKHTNEDQDKKLQILQKRLDDLFLLTTESTQDHNQNIRRVYDRTVAMSTEGQYELDNMKAYIYLGVCLGLMVLSYCVGVYFGSAHNVAEHTSIENQKDHAAANQRVSKTMSSVRQKQGCKKASHNNKDVTIPNGQTGQGYVCVIGFNKQTLSSHEQTVLEICQAFGVPMCSIPVLSSDDIPSIPNSSMFLVFVDFNERNVILEKPGLLQGEVKVLTVNQCIQIGDVFVIYVGDTGSKELPVDKLYNPELTSIQSHRLLSELEKKQRVFSIFESFSKSQSDLLTSAVGALTQ